MRKKIVLAVLVVSLFGIIPVFYFQRQATVAAAKRRQAAELARKRAAWTSLEESIRQELRHFKGEAGIVIKDLEYGWQITINKDEIFPSASLVKVPIMLACFKAATEARISLDDRIKLKAGQKVPGLGPVNQAQPGAEFAVKELIEYMITESDNTATNMLIDYLGFDYLNDCFRVFGLKDTNICRQMLDFKKRRAGWENFTTPSEAAFILEAIYKQKLINKAYSRMCLELLLKQKIRDRIPARLPVEVPVAHKTGLENGVCHDTGIVFTRKGDFLICVLTKHKNKTARPAKKFIAQVAYLANNLYESF